MTSEAKCARCARCGGDLPAPFGPALDALDAYLVAPETGDCPGHLRVDLTGHVLGCGAWAAEAYHASQVTYGPAERDALED
jgi:hypothetical protein